MDNGRIGGLMGMEHGGALLTAGEKPNVMTIGWCTQGIMWGKQVVCVPVRASRYTHEFMGGDFTVFFPGQPMKEAIALCGSKSGRDVDKAAALGLSVKRSDAVSSWYIDAPGTVLHCRTLYSADMSAEGLSPEVDARWYSDRDYHTLYFAEIVAVTEG